MKTSSFSAKCGPIEPKRRFYFTDNVTGKTFSVLARSKPESLRRAFKHANHTDLKYIMEGNA